MIVIARLTVKELVRRRVVWVLAILTVVSVALVGWGLDRLVTLAPRERLGRARDPDRRLAGADPDRLHVQLRAGDDGRLRRRPGDRRRPRERRRLRHPRPAAPARRPAARSLARLGGRRRVYAAASGLLAIGVAVLVTGYGPPDPLLAVAFLAGEALVLLTLTLALGSVLPSIAAGAIAVVGFGIGWMAGVMAGVGGRARRRGARPRRRGEPLAAPDRRPVARGHLRPRAVTRRADRGRPRAATSPTPTRSTPRPRRRCRSSIWSVVWMALVLGAATWWFDRRDL